MESGSATGPDVSGSAEYGFYVARNREISRGSKSRTGS
jgi:hypothetical protein